MADYLTEFIPEIWSAKILDAKEKVHVFGRFANRDYEGDLTVGQKVRIPQVGYPTINTYTRNSTSNLTKEYVNVSDMYLTIDQEKYFNILMDDVDVKQSKPDFMSKIAERAAYKLADTQDSYIAGLYAQAGITTTSNSASTYVQIGSSNARTEFLLMAAAFDRANIPRDNRWMIIPSQLMFELTDGGILEQSNNDRLWAQGIAPDAYGWKVYISNNVSSPSTDTTEFRIICGYGQESITMAEQINQTKMGELTQEGFGVYLKGLHVYGARLIPDRTGVIYANIDNG